MNKPILKIVLLLSIFIGILAGVLAIIPFAGEVAFWLLITAAAPFVIIFLKRHNILEMMTVRQSTVMGGVIGFMSFLAFCTLYVPIVVVLAKVFHYSPNAGVTLLVSNGTFGIILLLAVFMAVLSAVVNAFTGFVTFYLLDFLKTLNNDNVESQEQFYIRKQDK